MGLSVFTWRVGVGRNVLLQPFYEDSFLPGHS